MSTLAAVILNYNREQDLLPCVASIKAGALVPDWIIVVDNDSSDRSVQTLCRTYQDVLVLETGGNFGYAGGMNCGIARARELGADFVFVLNSDTFVDPGFVTEVVGALERHAEAGAAMGTIYHYPESTRVWCAGGRLVPWRGTGVCLYDIPDADALDGGIRRISFVTGCGFVARMTALGTVGAFDERFFMYVEDTELSRRLMAGGFSLLHVPQAKMYHRLGNEKPNAAQIYYTARNRLLFVRLSPPGPAKALAYICLFAIFASKLAAWSLSKRSWFTALRCGMEDFTRGTLGQGRGLTLGRVQGHE